MQNLFTEAEWSALLCKHAGMNAMQFTIKSRKLNTEITFSRPGRGYIYADLNGKQGTLGNQICDRGYLMGSTMSYHGDDQSEFESVCRSWYRAYLKRNQ